MLFRSKSKFIDPYAQDEEITEGLSKLGQNILGGIEGGVAFASDVLTAPIRGLRTLGELALSDADIPTALERAESTPTYKPFSKTGKKTKQKIDEFFTEYVEQTGEAFSRPEAVLAKIKPTLSSLKGEASARSFGEALANVYIPGIPGAGTARVRKGKQLSKEAQDFIKQELEKTKPPFIDPYAEYTAKTVAEQKAEILAKEQARLQPDINALEKEYGRTDWAPDLTTTGESRLPAGPETPAVMRVRPDRNVADQAEIGKPASLEAPRSPEGTIPYPGPELQPKRPLEAPRASEEALNFPLRQEVLDSPEFRKTLDNYQRWVDDAIKEGNETLATELRQDFGDLMRQYGVDYPSEAFNRLLYEKGQGTKLPIKSTNNPDLSAPKPWSETTPSAFGLADLDKPTVGGKFAKPLTEAEKTPAQTEKAIKYIQLGQFRKQRGGIGDPKFIEFKNKLSPNLKPYASKIYKEYLKQLGEAQIYKEGEVPLKLDIPGLEKLKQDFSQELIPWEDYKKNSIEGTPDLPRSSMLARNLQSGGHMVGQYYNNPFVKYGVTTIDNALLHAKALWTKALSGPDGLIKKLKISGKDQNHLNSIIQKYEGQKTLSVEELVQEGASKEVIDAYNKWKDIHEEGITRLNEQRAANGLKPIEPRPGYFPSYFRGDWYFEVINKQTGDVIYRPTGNYKGTLGKFGLQGIRNQMKKEHPEWLILDIKERPNFSKESSDRNAGYRMLIEELEILSPERETVKEAFRLARDRQAHKQSSFKQRLLDKAGVEGYEGNKYWESEGKNAQDAFKSMAKYIEAINTYIELNKASKVIANMGKDHADLGQINSWKYLSDYWGQARGITSAEGIALLGKGLDYGIGLISKELLGVSDKSLIHGIKLTKREISLSMLGFLRAGFLFSQNMQPAQFLPAHGAYLANKYKMKYSEIAPSGTFAGLDTIKTMIGEQPHSPLAQRAYKHALNNNLLEAYFVDEIQAARHKDMNALLKFVRGETAIQWFEKQARTQAYFFFNEFLHRNGIPEGKELYNMAATLTNRSMTDYRINERALVYNKVFGTILGEIVSGLTTFKHNNYTQLAMMAKHSPKAGLPTLLTTSALLGGLIGIYGREDMDHILNMLKRYNIIDPEIPNISDYLLKSDWWEGFTHGPLAGLTGIDISPLFNPSAIGDTFSLSGITPLFNRALEMTGSIASNLNPFQEGGVTSVDIKQLINDIHPKGWKVLNELLNYDKESGLVIDPKTGEGKVRREPFDITDPDWLASIAGLKSMQESKESQAVYQSKYTQELIEQKRNKQLKRIFELVDGGNDASFLIRKYVQSGDDPQQAIQTLISKDTQHKLGKYQTLFEKLQGIPTTTGGAVKYNRLNQYK